MAELTAYGKAIKHRLIDLNMTQTALMEEITRRTGLYCDCSYLKKIMDGHVSPPKIVAAINEILGLDP